MTIERRQFLPTSAVNGQGLNRELTVDEQAQSLRVHTTATPTGIVLAKKSDLDTVSNNLSNLSDSLASSVNSLQSQIDVINESSQNFCYYADAVSSYTAVTEPVISAKYPYCSAITIPLETPLTASEASSFTASVAFDPVSAMSDRYASFCTVTARQVDEDAYLPVVVIYSKTNSRSFNAWVTLWLNNLVTPQP